MSRNRRTGRRSALASVALLLIGLLATGGAYALVTSTATASTTAQAEATVDEGEKLFQANCSTVFTRAAAPRASISRWNRASMAWA